MTTVVLLDKLIAGGLILGVSAVFLAGAAAGSLVTLILSEPKSYY